MTTPIVTPTVTQPQGGGPPQPPPNNTTSIHGDDSASSSSSSSSLSSDLSLEDFVPPTGLSVNRSNWTTTNDMTFGNQWYEAHATYVHNLNPKSKIDCMKMYKKVSLLYESLYKVSDKMQELGFYANQTECTKVFQSFKRKLHLVFEHHHHKQKLMDIKCTIFVLETTPCYTLWASALLIQIQVVSPNHHFPWLMWYEWSNCDPVMSQRLLLQQIVANLNSQQINTGKTGSSFIARMHFIVDKAYSYNVNLSELEKITYCAWFISDSINDSHSCGHYLPTAFQSFAAQLRIC